MSAELIRRSEAIAAMRKLTARYGQSDQPAVAALERIPAVTSKAAEPAKVEARHYEKAYKNILAKDDYNSATSMYPSWKEIEQRANALAAAEVKT